MDIKETLKELAALTSVSGAESKIATTLCSMLKSYTNDIKIDNLGSVSATIKKPQNGAANILLDAHIDQIGLIVTAITDEGFLRVASVGGMDRRIMLAQRVNVHTKSGEIVGVIASMPPHLESGEEMKKTPTIDKLLVDVGMDKSTTEKNVNLGDRITIKANNCELLNGNFSGQACDDRAGVVSVLKAVDNLKGKDFDFGLTVLFSTQEETGERGAIAAGYSAEYDTVIAMDVSFAHTPDAVEYKCGKLGGGAMIGIAPSLTKSISDKLTAIAKEKNIPYQLEIMAGKTGTNADALSVAAGGKQSGLLSIPLRYMHTPIETVAISDIAAVSDLLTDFILSGKGV